MTLTRQQLEYFLSQERLSTYVAQCKGDFDAAIGLYRWNTALTAAFWEPIGHLEVALRNALSQQLASRHRRLDRLGSWLDDPNHEMTRRARAVVAAARARVRQKGKRASESQTISELGFGFWRFLVTKRLTALWPDLVSAFPHVPNRRREYDDLLAVAGYLDPDLPTWIHETSTVTRQLIGETAHDFRLASSSATAEPAWPSEATSAGAILDRANARRMSSDEFADHFGDLPVDHEG